MIIVPELARIEETFHDLPARICSRIRSPRGDLSSIHEELEKVPLAIGRGPFLDVVSNPETRPCKSVSKASKHRAGRQEVYQERTECRRRQRTLSQGDDLLCCLTQRKEESSQGSVARRVICK